MLGVIGLKLYNLMSGGKTYDLRMSFLLFAVCVMAFGFGIVIALLEPEELLYTVIFKIETWMLTLNVMTLIIEILMNISNKVGDTVTTYKKEL
jgi:hypothetical protein